MITSVNNNSNRNNYRPSFGTSVTVVNTLPKSFVHYEQISKLLKNLDGSIPELGKNKVFDDLRVTLSLIQGRVTMALNLFSPETSSLGRRKLIGYDILDLYFHKEGEGLSLINKFSEIIEASRARQNATHRRPALTTYPQDLLLSLYKGLDSHPGTIVKVDSKQVNPLLRSHVKLQDTFAHIDKTIEEIGSKPTGGLLKVRYQKINNAGNGTTIAMVLDLYSATKGSFGERLHVKSAMPISICDMDKDSNVTWVANGNDIHEAIGKKFSALVESLQDKIATHAEN